MDIEGFLAIGVMFQPDRQLIAIRQAPLYWQRQPGQVSLGGNDINSGIEPWISGNGM